MTNIVLSFLALFAGIVSLFTDVKERRGKIFSGVLGLTLLTTFGVQVYQYNQAEEEAKVQKEKAEQLIQRRDDENSKLITILSNFQTEMSEKIGILLSSFGYIEENPSPKTIQTIFEANVARTKLSESTNSIERNKVTVEYFPKRKDENVNGNIVESSIEELGFKVTLGEPGIPDVPTNAVFYGKNVPINDVKLVALTLIRAGIEIKYIRQFRNSTGRESLIQIGSGTAYISKPLYTVEAIQQATEFPL